MHVAEFAGRDSRGETGGASCTVSSIYSIEIGVPGSLPDKAESSFHHPGS
jgi:hypothetical protein